jgi:uncharacterized membrane protein YuzA (DUF378 family)
MSQKHLSFDEKGGREGRRLLARRDSVAFNRMWFRNGEALSSVQRVGYLIFSLAALALGVIGLRESISILTEEALYFGLLISTLKDLAFVSLGLVGIANALRFPRAKQTRTRESRGS